MKTVCITGASSGIGRELAVTFAKHDFHLLLVARNEEKLTELKEEVENKYRIHADVLSVDLTEEDGAKEVYRFCRENDLEINVLINNAGFGDFGRFDEGNLDKYLSMIDLNEKALVSLTYYFLKDMKRNGYGHIINVGSVASFMPGPYMAVYYATKAFVLSFSMALREELKDENIRVSTLCPAPTKSSFWENADVDPSASLANVFARSTKDVARTGYRIYEKNKAYSVDGLAYKVAVGFVRHLPIELGARVIGMVQKNTKKKAG